MTRVAVVGAGVIGCGWAAHLVARGIDVAVSDPDPGAEGRLRTYVADALPVLRRLGGSVEGWQDRLSFTVDHVGVLDGADHVQENGPEREDVKAELLAELDRATAPDVVIASSTSGTLPSTLAAACSEHPERVLVGHPFNPVYLVPLVEVVGAPDTPAWVVRRALDFYATVGKRPIHVRKEVPGHLANRLQAALWREAYSLVERGVATVADVDAAIAHGPGLRWAILGPLVNQHLSGGAGGLAHVLDHLGPPTQRWMDDLGTPRLSPELARTLVLGVEAELEGIDQAALVVRRDRLLADLLVAKACAEELP